MTNSDNDLVNRAEKGQAGQGAVIKAMINLKSSIDNLEKSTSIYSKSLIFLTIVIAVLTLFLLFKK